MGQLPDCDNLCYFLFPGVISLFINSFIQSIIQSFVRNLNDYESCQAQAAKNAVFVFSESYGLKVLLVKLRTLIK